MSLCLIGCDLSKSPTWSELSNSCIKSTSATSSGSKLPSVVVEQVSVT